MMWQLVTVVFTFFKTVHFKQNLLSLATRPFFSVILGTSCVYICSAIFALFWIHKYSSLIIILWYKFLLIYYFSCNSLYRISLNCDPVSGKWTRQIALNYTNTAAYLPPLTSILYWRLCLVKNQNLVSIIIQKVSQRHLLVFVVLWNADSSYISCRSTASVARVWHTWFGQISTAC